MLSAKASSRVMPFYSPGVSGVLLLMGRGVTDPAVGLVLHMSLCRDCIGDDVLASRACLVSLVDLALGFEVFLLRFPRDGRVS